MPICVAREADGWRQDRFRRKRLLLLVFPPALCVISRPFTFIRPLNLSRKRLEPPCWVARSFPRCAPALQVSRPQ